MVKHKETNELCAMKVLKRYSIEENEKSMRRALDERMVLEMVAGHPFIVQLKYAFQTEKNLYMVTDFMPGGDLHDYLQSHNFNLSETVVKHFFSEVLLAIEYLHSLGAVYRDLKPENVLLDKNGHIRLADMGLTKILEMGRMGRTRSFCGTRKFMAPEILKRKGHGQAADMWSLGVLLFSLLTGTTPYSDPNSFVLEELTFPQKVSEDAADLIRNLLQPEASRFTIEQVKSHKWLEGVEFEDLYELADEPVPDVWENWELKILGEGRFLHTKMDKLRDLTIGDSVEKGEHFAPRRSGKLHRLVKRGSRVNLIPGYMFTRSVSRGSFSAGSYVSSE
uniref:Protein kinase domain-containing protein n=1 Tax=Rhodosorus marinus TaxID=101924 RepID=A0A7S2ZBZ9_9RHOD